MLAQKVIVAHAQLGIVPTSFGPVSHTPKEQSAPNTSQPINPEARVSQDHVMESKEIRHSWRESMTGMLSGLMAGVQGSLRSDLGDVGLVCTRHIGSTSTTQPFSASRLEPPQWQRFRLLQVNMFWGRHNRKYIGHTSVPQNITNIIGRACSEPLSNDFRRRAVPSSTMDQWPDCITALK